jgi:hypothetical protein
MNIPIKEQVTMSKKVRFSVPSILVLLPNTNSKCAGAGWYSQDEMESFKALFVISVAEVRMKLSRGGIDAIAATEILGMEKRLTRHVSKKLSHNVIVNLFQPLTDALSACCSRSSQRNTPPLNCVSCIGRLQTKRTHHVNRHYVSLRLFSKSQVISLNGHLNVLEQRRCSWRIRWIPADDG